MPYFACFRRHEGHLFRIDTRIYLRDAQPSKSDSCIAAIIGKNPGSACGTVSNTLTTVSLNGDRLLPTVRCRFQNAYAQAGLTIPQGAYVRVWNLFYLCNKTSTAATKAYRGIRIPLTCTSESRPPPIVWFAWGPPTQWHNNLAARFRNNNFQHPFFVDIESGQVIAAVPGPNCKAKHTQGMRAETVETYLAKLLRETSDNNARAADRSSHVDETRPTL